MKIEVGKFIRKTSINEFLRVFNELQLYINLYVTKIVNTD